MRKLLLFAMGAMMSIASFAQEEDVTYLIKNAGFDQDLTFQADGTMKEAVTTNTSLSDRSWAYICADNTVYARPKSSSSQSRPDGRKMEAVNGFLGQVDGWTLVPSSEFPKCEWTYFGTAPYALGATAVPIADDGTTYMVVPSTKPEVDNGEDNIGFVYLRAGWGGAASYKQEVELPCARYRLEYWTININTSASASATDLSKITCRQEVFKDESGSSLNATEWTKHEFEFTPTARFTMEFGFKSASDAGSGSNPIVCIDGIKLFKIGEADPDEILQALMYECEDLSGQAAAAGYTGLSGQIGDYGFNLEEIDTKNLEAFAKAIEEADVQMTKFRAALAEMENVDAILAKMDNLLRTTDFAGKDDFQTAYAKILNYKEGSYSGEEDYVSWILGAVEEATAAIKAYYLSQKGSATEENPADFTYFVQHPWFIKEAFEPTNYEGEWIFPNAENYTDGSSHDDFSSAGWEKTGSYTEGDQRLNFKFGYPCWNAWGSGFTGTIAVGQTIKDLPNGYYTVSAELVTQAGCMTNQHVYAETAAEKKISNPLTTEGWDEGLWETVAMTAEQKVLVVDGKLTIGAEGTGTGSGSAGWFCATHFQLHFLGEASEEVIVAAIKTSFDNKIAAAKELAGKMHFALDRKALNDSIAKYEVAADKDAYLIAIEAITVAIANAETSEAKYLDYLPEETPEDISGKTLLWVKALIDGKAVEGKTAYAEDEKAIAQSAYDYVMGWIACDSATYVDMDKTVDLLKNYVNNYIPAYQKAAEVAAAAGETGKTALQNLMAQQKAALIAEMQTANKVNEFVKALNELIALVNKQNIVDDTTATDYTAFIINPNIEAEDGWNFERGNGDKNTTSGQWFDDSSTRYIDSYHSTTDSVAGEEVHTGLEGFKAWQLVKDLPNGKYQVGAYTRTPAEGAYIFTVVTDTAFVEIPLNYYFDETTQEDVIASDKFGPIWEEAKKAVESGTYTEEQSVIYNANNAQGRGWKHQTMDVEVTNHELTIGAKAGVAGENEKAFTGNWFSVGGWTLKLIELGNNEGWGGPIVEGIESVQSNTVVIEGIYTLTGAKVNKLQRGVNIVVRNGKAMKVLVK